MRYFRTNVNLSEFINVYDMERLESYYRSSKDAIKRLEDAIKDIRGYQNDLKNHMKVVQNTEYIKVVTLTRREGYGIRGQKSIDFYVRLEYRPKIDNYELLHTIIKYDYHENFQGRERHQAIKYAEQLAKDHDCELIKVGSW